MLQVPWRIKSLRDSNDQMVIHTFMEEMVKFEYLLIDACRNGQVKVNPRVAHHLTRQFSKWIMPFRFGHVILDIT